MTFQTSIQIEDAAVLEQDIRDRLTRGIAAKLVPVYADIHEEIADHTPAAQIYANASDHAEALARFCLSQSAEIRRLTETEKNFQTRLTNAVDEGETRAAILDFARELGADRKQIQRDRKALNTYFDADAVVERFHKRVGERERTLAHALERLGVVTADAVVENPQLVQSAFFIELSENLLAEMRSWKGDARIRCAAHRSQALIAQRIDKWPFGYWFETVLSATRRVAMDESEDVWVQCAAFDALLALSPNSMATAIASRIERPMSSKKPQVRDNELFLRRYLVRLISANFKLDENFVPLLNILVRDESGAVRQAIADSLHLVPTGAALQLFVALRQDSDPQVRAALFADAARFAKAITATAYAEQIVKALNQDSEEFVLRIALDAAAGLAAHLRQADLPEAERIYARLREAIIMVQARELSPRIMRWADEAKERVWLASNDNALEIARILQGITHDQRESEIRSVIALRPWLKRDVQTVGRVMAVLAQNDFGLSLKKGVVPRIQRGEWIKRRLWRFMFEHGNSATDKRQAFTHTTGRDYFGTMLAPGARMAELAPTKVPGEPLFESAEGGWRNYLPLVDLMLTALDHGKPIEIYTSAGVTELVPPRSLFIRARRFWQVSRQFARIADQRNSDPVHYLETLRDFGFAITFRGHENGQPLNPHVAKFFAKAAS